jgi:vacuolar-type H+-ATPase subunit I/STV1
MRQLRFTQTLKDISRQIAEGVIRRSPFPINVSTFTIKNLYDALDAHVSFLNKEKDKAENANDELNLLQETEKSFICNLNKIEYLEKFYRKFWEEDIPNDLENIKGKILQLYGEYFNKFKEEIDYCCDFHKVAEESKKVSKYIGSLDGDAARLIRRYEELFEGVKYYFRTGSLFIIRLQSTVIPKLIKSDKTKINEILTELKTLYESILNFIEDVIKQVIEKNIPPQDIPNTRTTFHEKERNLREALIQEIKDLDKESTLILMEVVKVLAQYKAQWLSVAEVCEMVAKQTNKDYEVIKKTLLEITEKGFLTLGIGF